MANVSTMFSADSDVITRNLARNGAQAGLLRPGNLERIPLPQSSSEQLLALLDAAGGRTGGRVAGRVPGKRRGFSLGEVSPELVRLLQAFRQLKGLS